MTDRAPTTITAQFSPDYETPREWAGTGREANAFNTLRLFLADVLVGAIAIGVAVLTVKDQWPLVALVVIAALFLIGLTIPAMRGRHWHSKFVHDDRMKAWTDLPIHWQDWPRLRTTTLTPSDVKRFLDVGLYPPRRCRVAVMEALVEAGVDPQALDRNSGVALHGWIPVLGLLRYGLSLTDIERICGKFDLTPPRLIDLINAIPESGRPTRGMSAPDLLRFETSGIFSDAYPRGARRIEQVRDDIALSYATHGWRASYFEALGWSEQDCRAATEQGVGAEELAVMLGLLSVTEIGSR